MFLSHQEKSNEFKIKEISISIDALERDLTLFFDETQLSSNSTVSPTTPEEQDLNKAPENKLHHNWLFVR